jgi:hypothetical protein
MNMDKPENREFIFFEKNKKIFIFSHLEGKIESIKNKNYKKK